ncbi:MAG: hypothetical protein HYZ49_19465 [Chloroflexi bacterium]|nr:hypothetical protein [Chloroflexota bacterium]
MPPNAKDANQFLRWMYTLQEKSEILLEEASDEPLDKVARDLTRLSSMWEKYIEHAERVGISLLDYKEPTRAIIKNLERTKKAISKHEHDPALSRYLQPMWPLFDNLDKVLVVIGYRPVFRPLGEAFIGIYIQTDRLLNPPPTRLLLPPPATSSVRTSKPQGEVEQVWVEHNVHSGQKKGMTIHIKFNVRNLKDAICRAAAYFRFRSGQKLYDSNNSYRAGDGQVAVGEEFVPNYVSTAFSDFRLFMPYNELHLAKGKHDAQFQISLYVPSTNTRIAMSNYIDFQYQRR